MKTDNITGAIHEKRSELWGKMPVGTSGRKGFTLVEVLIVIAIVSILLTIASFYATEQLRRLKVRDCAQKLAGDIKHARASAQTEGRRAQLTVAQAGTPQNLHGAGTELWLTFLDSYPNPSGSFDTGEAVLSSSSCGSSIIVESNTLDACANGTMGVANRCLWFTTLGTLGTSVTDRSIVLVENNKNAYKVRVNIVSLIGHVTVQACEVVSGINCLSANQWRDI